MVPSASAAAAVAALSARERTLLTDVRRPIVLVERDERDWMDAVVPGLHTLGVVCPYSGLHHLLFDPVEGALVMTSANLPGEPMCTDAAAILDELGDVVDAALVHDRDVVARCDDSVVRIVDGARQSLPGPFGVSPFPPRRRRERRSRPGTVDRA